ncbi:MAG: amino-acid N-acetyltransferase [Gammaproteobacteria bacterium]|nr:amino-acid N-acetyltransferase [Gammaproteobacteria bacterium]
MPDESPQKTFATLFRNSAPYINAFRGRTFVLVFNGEALLADNFDTLVHDFALLQSLGIRLVLVYGARPQIDRRLQQQGLSTPLHKNVRITDSLALQCVKEAVGSARADIEALLSMGLANSPMAGVRLRVTSGNFVIAKPYGVRDGIDYLHTGEIRRIDAHAIHKQLDNGAIVLLAPLGYSPTGEIFNVTAESVAAATAVALNADKLIYLTEGLQITDDQQHPLRELSMQAAQQLLEIQSSLSDDIQHILSSAIEVCQYGVRRVHILDRKIDGVLLQELFTRDGAGTLINRDHYEDTRPAVIDDVPGILELIKPLEQQGVLVRRSRERLETEINRFMVVERDGMIVACAALYPLKNSPMGELACLAVHPDYQKQGRGDALLNYIETLARQQKLQQLFVLSTHTSHWFRERGFEPADIEALPAERQAMYNYQRNSKVFIKQL